MHGRVECVVPILDRSLRARIWELIQLYEGDQRQTWDMTATGNYEQRGKSDVGVQTKLMQIARQGALSNESDWNEDLPE